MGRPVYTYELIDPDFSWLLSTFRENNPHYVSVENEFLPVVLLADPDYVESAYVEDLNEKDVPDFSEK